MPFITVTTWPNQTDEQCRHLIEELTKTTHEVTGAPLDKITVVIQEIPQSRWGEAGVMATHPEFPTLSRKY
ncbi:tautomerase family protein [Glycomyces buryatensis]|uniref:Tautomerase n=1 Tax=Glycomyces buryatensis TaxID=2570927 RepID=A0A4S8Q0W2_9ACTN|nr:tautomerase family protein [Glycomyces buryatensis]THV37737.1 tautomerase [Glycomyces buryatensis]